MSNTSKDSKRNLLSMTLEGTFFFFGIAFFGESTVIPIFVDTFTGSVQLLGLTMTLIMIAKLLPKLLLGPYLSSVKDMSKLLKVTIFIHRPLPFLMIPVLLFVKEPLVIFWSFVIMYCTFWGINGLTAVSWGDVFARTIPGNLRGQIQGNQLFFGGIASLCAGYFIKLILDNDAIPENIKYVMIFAAGGITLVISAIVILPVKDTPRTVKKEDVHVLKYFMTLPKLLNKNDNYKKMTISQVFSRFAELLIPFIIVICKNKLGYSTAEVSTLVVCQVLGSMIGGFLWGKISKRFGNRNVIVTAEIIGLAVAISTLICLLTNTYINTFPIMCGIIIVAGAKTGAWLGYGNYMFDVVGEKNRIDYMTLNTIVLFPLAFCSYLAGLVNDLFGFYPLIIFTIVVASICTYSAVKLETVKH
ncbi:MFS transporter [Clostridium cellulovorans]|uniref:Major facilitator superfamily MFS_1 n=1 Tax=Clostridium cellulovorans (strain ATCC 35296 / DSM 3052 / OCM 3 / 743B) TaxID=573061 RepID=D9SN81_CLOC7|nr:MFS transporter [Clostridium cellulovorans]ADL53873.1 major facilitator superfamily MFS_1 [Clostridium cellulovorans 743B]